MCDMCVTVQVHRLSLSRGRREEDTSVVTTLNRNTKHKTLQTDNSDIILYGDRDLVIDRHIYWSVA